MPRPPFALLAALVLLLAGCGETTTTSTSQPVPAPAGPTITLTGTATYERVPATATGLDYSATVARPIRGATVQVRDPSGQWVWYAATTNAAGEFSITAPASNPVVLVVLSAIGTTKVVDNADATYALARSFTTPAVSSVIAPFSATTGWGGSAYTGSRNAAPFAILDTIYDARAMVTAAAGATTFPPLTVEWYAGSEEGTYFIPSQSRLAILGKANADTDEFDASVIAHEWGHYWEENFSRSDNIGGSHGGNDMLDERVAFGEGFANAFSGFVTRSPDYYDTMFANQATTGVILDLEADTQVGTTTAGRPREGAWSEASVQELLWDLYDGGADAIGSSDADGVALGFAPIHAIMTTAQKTFPGFTTVYSFLDALKAANAASASAIATLATNENILAHDAFEETGSGRTRYAVVAGDAVGVGPFSTDDTFGAIPGDDPGNKLFNWRYFRVTVPGSPSTTQWAFTATPTGGGDLVLVRGGTAPAYADQWDAGATERLVTTASAGQVLVFAVGAFDATASFNVRFGPASVVTKPAPAPVVAVEPDAPLGDG